MQMNTLLFMQSATQPSISAAQLGQVLCTYWNSGGQSVTEDLLQGAQYDLQAAMGFVPTTFHQEQIGLLMSDREFVTWLKSLATGVLILHDERALNGHDSLSILSHLSALIAEILAAPGMIRLKFFCGLRSAPGTMFDGANGLLRSLTMQLLQAFGNTSFPINTDLSALVQGFMRNPTVAAFEIFGMLLSNIPAGMIYIIIDGAFWYGTEARDDEMQAAMHFLAKQAADLRAASRGLILKILITNPTPRQESSWNLQASNIYLSQNLLTGGHGGDAARRLASM